MKTKKKLLKKIAKRPKKLTSWRESKKKETALQGKNQFLPASPIQSKGNSNGTSSKLPLMTTGNTSQPDPLNPPKNNINIPKYDGNLPPEVAAELDKIVGEMVVKVEPEMQRIALILKTHGIPDTSVELMMGAINPEFLLKEKMFGFPSAPAPADDLVEGICKILNLNYENNCFNVLGIPFDRNRNAAFEIGKIMEAARKRDKESLARELEGLANKIRSK